MISQYMDDINNIRNGVVTAGGRTIGFFSPSTIIGTAGELMYINGPKGITSFNKDDAQGFWAGLLKSGSILFGSPEEVSECSVHLADPRSSRTFSYLTTEASDCNDLVRRLRGIREASVVVIGCGGIGSISAMNLAGAGVAKLTLIDDDRIEESNLNRQFFWESDDVGSKKVDVLRRVIEKRFADVIVEVQSTRLSNDSLVKIADAHTAAVVSADEPLGISVAIANRSSSFVVSGSYFHGYSGYFAGLGASEDVEPMNIQWARSPGFVAPSFGPANTEIAGAISSLCINYLSQRSSMSKMKVKHAWRGNRLIVDKAAE